MNRQQQEIALDIARDVWGKRLTAAAGARKLALEAGLPEGSAKIVIDVYQKLCSGENFQRHLSRVDMLFFLNSFGSEGSTEELSNAVHALRLHIGWSERKKISQRSNRTILVEQEARLANLLRQEPIYLSVIEDQFVEKVERSLGDQSETRRRRLEQATKLPRRVTKLVYVYERNADVVAEVLVRAKGICECCQQPAPFIRKSDGTPYLEVHHKIMLSAGGEDTVDNAEALCANCHRHRHYGIDGGTAGLIPKII